MEARMRFRLSTMMALVYAVQGAFWPLLAVHLSDLGIPSRERGWIFATLAIGSTLVPLGAGQLVDRVFAGQKVMAVIFAISSSFLAAIAAGLTSSPGSMFLLFLAFWMVTAPVFSLANAIALRHLPRPLEQFSKVRLWGTIGWMSVGWVVSGVMLLTGGASEGRGAPEAFWVAAALALFMSVFALTLPDTPPLPKSASDDETPPRGWGALQVASQPGMLRFLAVAFGLSLTTPFVYQVLPTHLTSLGLPRSWVPTAMTLGQWPEILMLATLPWMLARFGSKGTLAIGLGAWTLRYATLAIDPPLWLAVAGIPLHGVGVACFTIAGQLYMDGQSRAEGRASAQALYTVVTSGVGSFLGSLLAGDLMGRFHGDYPAVFLVPCMIDFALIVYFCAGFRPNALNIDSAGASDVARRYRNEAVRASVVRVGTLVTESADG